VNHRPFAITLAIIAHVALLPVDVGAQPAPVPTQRQSDATQNLQDFDFVVAKITANYAGYETKTTGDEMARLTALTADLRNQARLASSPTALLAAMTQYIAFFKDKHTTVSVISSNDTSPSNTGPFAARVGVTEASARRQAPPSAIAVPQLKGFGALMEAATKWRYCVTIRMLKHFQQSS
jgi:hypothetical protein